MKAIFAGSFDPPTHGHWDVIQRAAPLFEKLYIVIATNTTKAPFLDSAFRMKVFAELLAASPLKKKCEVIAAPGLVADLCAKYKVDYLIRGVRSSADLERELPMSVANEVLSGGITTIIIPSTKENSFVSSSLVREIYTLGGDISSFVPHEVVKFLKTTHSKKSKGNKK